MKHWNYSVFWCFPVSWPKISDMILDNLRSSEETLVGFCFGAVFCRVAENLTSVTVLSHLRQQVIESGSTYCVKSSLPRLFCCAFSCDSSPLPQLWKMPEKYWFQWKILVLEKKSKTKNANLCGTVFSIMEVKLVTDIAEESRWDSPAETFS